MTRSPLAHWAFLAALCIPGAALWLGLLLWAPPAVLAVAGALGVTALGTLIASGHADGGRR